MKMILLHHHRYPPIIILFLLVFAFKLGESHSKTPAAFDNVIIGQPYISCQRDRIVIEVITERLFTGKIFVKGDYSNPQCTKTFRNGNLENSEILKNQNSKSQEEIFMGTVTKSREPYVEEQRKLADFEKSAKFEHPDIAEAFLLSRKNSSFGGELGEEEGEWKGVGGVSADGNAVFGGTRGEELRVFGKSGISTTTITPKSAIRGREGGANQVLTSEKLTSSLNCPPTTTCAPCACEDRRSRRATNSIRLEVPLNSCNTKRDRKLNPPSVVVSLIAVVSFHDSFITKLDKAYHIQCAYAEAEKTVSTDLDVNMDGEQEINGTVEAPSCDYLISDKNGNSVQNSLVGELVRHSWNCKGGLKNKLRMLVHKCFVKDGGGQQYEVIDDNGCTLDRIMLQTPNYSENGMSAEVDAFIFKFPDRSTVDFRCTITFCSVDDEECREITPPKCDQSNRKKRSPIHPHPSMSLHSNSLTVFDLDSSKNDIPQKLENSKRLSESFHEFQQKFCISIASFGILISASTFFATISLAIIFSYFFLRFNQKFQNFNL